MASRQALAVQRLAGLFLQHMVAFGHLRGQHRVLPQPPSLLHVVINLPPWRYLEVLGTWSWATCFRWPCSSRGLDLMASTDLFPPQLSCDFVITAADEQDKELVLLCLQDDFQLNCKSRFLFYFIFTSQNIP